MRARPHGSPRPNRLRGRSLRTRLLLFVGATLVVVCAAMALTTVLAQRAYPLGNLDDRVSNAAARTLGGVQVGPRTHTDLAFLRERERGQGRGQAAGTLARGSLRNCHPRVRSNRRPWTRCRRRRTGTVAASRDPPERDAPGGTTSGPHLARRFDADAWARSWDFFRAASTDCCPAMAEPICSETAVPRPANSGMARKPMPV